MLCSKEILIPILVDAASKKKVHMVYEQVISSLKSKINTIDYVRGNMFFAYYDINNDGTDELFVLYAGVDDKKVPKKQYNKYLKKMSGTKGIRMYKETNANLNKLR